MEMQNVLDRLKQIENPTEDQAAAIKSAEAMTKAPEPAVAESVPTTATGEGTYTEYKPAEPADYAKLAGIPTLAVQTEPTNESVETEEQALTEAEYFVTATDLVTYEIDVEADSEEEAEDKAYDILKSENAEEYSAGGEGAIVQSVQMHEEAETAEEVIAEGPTRKDFQMVADLLKANPDEEKRKELAKDYCDKFQAMNPRFDKERFMAACGIEEAYESVEEAYDPAHVAGIIKKHEANGHEVEMDPFKDDEAGFTVTFKDGSRRHYHYTKSGVKVDSLEPVDAMVDPDAPKRERGRPKKEAVEEEVDELTRQFESKLTDLLPEEEVVVTESAEQINESVNVSQTINDEGQESVNINAQGNPEHIDMVKQLLRLAGQPRGYEEYTGEPEPEAEEANEELANAPDVKVADVDTQLNKMSGGLNGPKDKSALRGDSVKLHDDKDLAESLLDLYKEYKG